MSNVSMINGHIDKHEEKKPERDRLVELLDQITKNFRFTAWENTDKIADYLLENGVETKEWISVTEKLPMAFIDVLVYEKETRRICRGFYNGKFWIVEDIKYNGSEKNYITHWREQPHLPKDIEPLCEKLQASKQTQ